MQMGELLDRSQDAEFDTVLETVEGEVPADIEGTTLRNGPAVFQIGEDSVSFLDGAGALSGVEFGHGAPYFRSRFSRTPLYREEAEAGRMVRRRIFTNLPRRWSNFLNVNLGNPANHDVYHWGDRIYLGDVGNYAVDPKTFEVIGAETWNGAVGKRDQMAAMPRPDHEARRLIAYTVAVGAKQVVTMLELDESLHATNRRPVRIEGFIHDQIATPRYFLAVDNPARASAAKILWGKEPVFPSMSWPEGMRPQLLLVGRKDDEVKRCALPRAFSIVHFINAYEEGDRLVVDAIANMGPLVYDVIYPAPIRPENPRQGPPVELLRYVIDLRTMKVECSSLCELAGDTPEVDEHVHGKPYRHAWFIGLPGCESDPFNLFVSDSLLHVDVEDGRIDQWRAGPGRTVSQPSFTRHRDGTEEGDGYVTTWITDYEQERTHVAIFDAQQLSEGPVAMLDTGAYLPPASHCRFADGLRIR